MSQSYFMGHKKKVVSHLDRSISAASEDPGLTVVLCQRGQFRIAMGLCELLDLLTSVHHPHYDGASLTRTHNLRKS